eukprot:5223631-Pyramimonas_sp.AAC.1
MVALMHPRALAASLVFVGASALDIASDVERSSRSSRAHVAVRQTPEELGFSDTGVAEHDDTYGHSEYSEEFCLDIGAKGFPIP